MIVHEVLTGASYRLPEQLESESLRLEDVKAHLSKVSGVAVNQLILMTQGGQLASDSQLSSPLLMFSRDAVRMQGPPPVIYRVPSFELFLPPIAAEERGVVLTERRLHGIASKFHELKGWVVRSEAQCEAVRAHIRLLATAHAALLDYSSSYESHQVSLFHRLLDRFNAHRYESLREIEQFDSTISSLEQHDLAPGLRSHSRRTLADLIDISALKQWKDGYNTELARLQIKFAEVEADVKRVCRKNLATQIISDESEINFSELKELCYRALKAYEEYRELCERYIFDNDSHSKARLYQENWQVDGVAKMLSVAEGLKQKLNNKIEELIESRNSACLQLVDVLRMVTEANMNVKDVVKSQVAMLNSLVARSIKHLRYLVVPRLLPEAYQATLYEVSRRRTFRKNADGMLAQLKMSIEVETNKRCEFLKQYRYVIPKNFIPQLSQAPILDYKPDDPDRFLPEVDVGLIVEESEGTSVEESWSDEAVLRSEDLGAEIKKLKAEKEEMRAQIEAMAASIEELRSQLEASNAARKQSEEDAELVKEQLAKAQAALADTNNMRLAALEVGRQAESDKESLRQQLSEACDQISLYKKLLKQPQADLSSLAVLLEQPPDSSQERLISVVRSLQEENIRSKAALRSSISFMTFEEGSLALFFPSSYGHFVAFNCNSPFHFLDFDSLKSTTKALLNSKNFIVGEIKKRKLFTAASEYNPFSLNPGTQFTVLSINEVDF